MQHRHDGRVLGVVLGIRFHIRCVDRTAHRIHLQFNHAVGLQRDSGIQYRVVAQHVAALQGDDGLLERRFQRGRHLKVHFLGLQVNTGPVDLGFGGLAVRYLHPSVRLGQVCHHAVLRVMDILEVHVRADASFVQTHLAQVAQTNLGLGCSRCLTAQSHALGQERFEVRNTGIDVGLEIQEHVRLDIADGAFGFQTAVPQLRLCLMQGHYRHLRVAVRTFCGGVQGNRTFQLIGRNRLGEPLRHKGQQGLDVPGVGCQAHVHVDGVVQRHLAFSAQVQIVDCQPGTVQCKVHRVEVHRHRGNQFDMQTVSISLAFESGTYVLCVQGDEHVVPTGCFGTQVGCTDGCLNRVLVVHERDGVRLQVQAVHGQLIERQRESGRVLFGCIR